ncbi:AAA family ATPase [Bacteroides sp. OttesenSCG-928-E20]|nr:AAA family ATPase [Bacteroides sp. OttesenSCG-928-N06]MDL2299534.1 AAA family ATPase [Bacteroides sp. OttesenSCG-928-E20]MDL2305682.1 AAA family ATPase [Bacteroides sp. OttesenSCG-928-D19]
MFKRKILQDLSHWADSKYRKPLVLRGARQVGKTTVVNEFGKEFDNYLYINLEKAEAKQLFESSYPIEDLISILFLYTGKSRKAGRTLIFLDEIQNSPNAIAQLRYFYEEAPDIYIISAGSLLESLLDVHISFPVGRVEYMALRPCSFFEFLEANGEMSADTDKLLDNLFITHAFHERFNRLFTTYALIGGMPEVVNRYVIDKDLVGLGNIYESLLQGYRDDIEKYAKNRTLAETIRYILNEGWAKAGQTITLGGFAGSPYKARETGEAFRTLEKAFIMELVYPVTDTKLPAISNQKRSPKLIWLDTGLVNYASNLQREFFNSKDIMDIYKGAIAEQVVAQELLTLSTKVGQKRNFWVRAKEGSNAEVDFVWIHHSKIIPIEIKSGNNAHLRSLHSFMNGSPHNIAVRIWKEQFSINEVQTNQGKKFFLFNLPYYLTGLLPNILNKFEVYCTLIQILYDYGYTERKLDDYYKNETGPNNFFGKRRFFRGTTGTAYGVIFDWGDIKLSVGGSLNSIGYETINAHKLFPFLYFESVKEQEKKDLKYVMEKTIGHNSYDAKIILEIDTLFTTDHKLLSFNLAKYPKFRELYPICKARYLEAKQEFIERYQII